MCIRYLPLRISVLVVLKVFPLDLYAFVYINFCRCYLCFYSFVNGFTCFVMLIQFPFILVGFIVV